MFGGACRRHKHGNGVDGILRGVRRVQRAARPVEFGSGESEPAGIEIRWVEISEQGAREKHACERSEKVFVCEE